MARTTTMTINWEWDFLLCKAIEHEMQRRWEANLRAGEDFYAESIDALADMKLEYMRAEAMAL